MTRRLGFAWPDPRPFADRPDGTIRILAASDDPDPVLDHAHNRDALGRIDLIVGCGDLEADYLTFLGDAFRAPLLYVRGNHDRGAAWEATRRLAPEPLVDARVHHVLGIPILGLSWPGEARGRAARDEFGAWAQTLRVRLPRVRRSGDRPLVISHVPPRGAGDDPEDPYHLGFAAYRSLARRLHPPLWLHGHTTIATVASTRARLDETLLINVTGSLLVTLHAAGHRADTGALPTTMDELSGELRRT